MSLDIIKALELLGLEPGVSFQEVKKVYRGLSKKWHPDRYTQYPEMKDEATRKLKQINEAYAFIKAYNEEHGDIRSLSGGQKASSAPGSYAGKSSSGASTPVDSQPLYNAPPLQDFYDLMNSLHVIEIFCLLVLAVFLYIGFFSIFPSKTKESFTLHSSFSEIVNTQGKFNKGPGNKYYSGDSWIEYTPDSGITAYENKGNLKIAPDSTLKGIKLEDRFYYTIDASKDEVMLRQGMPDYYSRELWKYKNDTLEFQDGLLVSYNNTNNNLKVKPTIQNAESYNKYKNTPYFTTGASMQEVMAIQGSPDAVKDKNCWLYGKSKVIFNSYGKAYIIKNYDHNLHFRE